MKHGNVTDDQQRRRLYADSNSRNSGAATHVETQQFGEKTRSGWLSTVTFSVAEPIKSPRAYSKAFLNRLPKKPTTINDANILQSPTAQDFGRMDALRKTFFRVALDGPTAIKYGIELGKQHAQNLRGLSGQSNWKEIATAAKNSYALHSSFIESRWKNNEQNLFAGNLRSVWSAAQIAHDLSAGRKEAANNLEKRSEENINSDLSGRVIPQEINKRKSEWENYGISPVTINGKKYIVPNKLMILRPGENGSDMVWAAPGSGESFLQNTASLMEKSNKNADEIEEAMVGFLSWDAMYRIQGGLPQSQLRQQEQEYNKEEAEEEAAAKAQAEANAKAQAEAAAQQRADLRNLIHSVITEQFGNVAPGGPNLPANAAAAAGQPMPSSSRPMKPGPGSQNNVPQDSDSEEDSSAKPIPQRQRQSPGAYYYRKTAHPPMPSSSRPMWQMVISSPDLQESDSDSEEDSRARPIP